jgi:Protein of unknown function (DUF1579)
MFKIVPSFRVMPWFFVLGCLFVVSAEAQPPQQKGPEHAKIAEMCGTWDTVMDIGGQKSNGTAIYTSICDGMWISSNFEGTLDGKPFQGHGVDGFDQVKKEYIGYWFDSMTSFPIVLSGNYDADGKVLTMVGTMPGPAESAQKYRSTTEMNGPDQMTFKMYMGAPGGKENLAFTVTYTRRK